MIMSFPIKKKQQQAVNLECSEQPNRVISQKELGQIAAGYEDNSVRIFDITSGKLTNEFIAHSDSITGLCYDNQRGLLMTCAHDGSIRSWDTKQFRCLHDLPVSFYFSIKIGPQEEI